MWFFLFQYFNSLSQVTLFLAARFEVEIGNLTFDSVLCQPIASSEFNLQS